MSAATGQGGADISSGPQLAAVRLDGAERRRRGGGERLDHLPGGLRVDGGRDRDLGRRRGHIRHAASGYHDRGAVEVVGPETGGGFTVLPVGSPKYRPDLLGGFIAETGLITTPP
ncbi:hypothetical protein ACIRJM_06275 [Streptomyces sp. NPDC102405]|jgi:hypothetical protein|uniref:hypothetical protein n=1 Tax=Streptomyces sp. NPDC102405 TaxID=3366170 RepID=UPI003810C7E1